MEPSGESFGESLGESFGEYLGESFGVLFGESFGETGEGSREEGGEILSCKSLTLGQRSSTFAWARSFAQSRAPEPQALMTFRVLKLYVMAVPP